MLERSTGRRRGQGLRLLGTVFVLVAAALLVAAAPAFASAGDIFDSTPSNTQIRPAIDQTATTPDFTGQPWQTPVAGSHPAYSILPDANWLGETNDVYGHTINQHWEQYRAVFDLPSGGTSAGVELLVDNEVTAMTINGVQFGCGYDQTCNYYNGDRFAIAIPSSALQPTGNELLITVLDYETAPSTGGLTFKVVSPGIVANQTPAGVSGIVGSPLSTSGGFRQTIDADATAHPISITADNTFGTFTDHGDGTWSWMGTPAAAGSGTITVTATDDRGLTATESFTYAATPAPTIALLGTSCVTISGGTVEPFQVRVTNPPYGFYVFAEAAPAVPDTLDGLWAYGTGYAPGPVTVDVGTTYQSVPGSPSSLWLTVRDGSDYSNLMLASLQVPVCVPDTTPPTTTDNAPAAWQNADTTVTLTAADGDGSGVAATHYSVDGGPDQVGTTVTIAAPADHSNDGTHTITYYSVDNAGNAETPHSTTVRIDTTPPAAAATAETAPNANGWYAGDVTVDWNWADPAGGSGLDATSCTSSGTSTGEGTIVLRATCSDLAGNVGQASYTVQVDKTAPAVAANHIADGQNGWNVSSPVAETVSASDGGSGLTADSPSCTLDGSPVTLTSAGNGTWTFAVAGDGVHAVSCLAADAAGNTASASDTVQIDTAAPTLAPAVSPNPIALNGSATASPNATDGGSGLASASCDGVDSSAYGDFTVTCTATDAAGNTATATTTYSVTVQATKQAILAQIQAAAGSASRDDKESLRDAAARLAASLAPSLWTDSNHPTSKRVFELEQETTDALGELVHRRHASVGTAAVQGWIDAVVADDRALATIAIADAAGGDARKLAEAQKELAKGDSEAARGHANAAIEHYGNAWQQAQQPGVSHGHDHGGDR